MESSCTIASRRYLGAKTRLLEFIDSTITGECGKFSSFLDLFGGTGVVANHFFGRNKILINDFLESNYHSYVTWFGKGSASTKKLSVIVAELNSVSKFPANYFSINYGNKYFSQENAKKIGFIRGEIDRLSLCNDINSREKSILLTSLIYCADRVANTCGHYDAYRKKIDKNDLFQLGLLKFNQNREHFAQIFQKDANDLIRDVYADVVYIDPPYNSRQYGDAYHLLENLVVWDKPKLVGVAKKKADRSDTKSKYCTRDASSAFSDLVNNIQARHIVISYNNMEKRGNARSQAKISGQEIESILATRGKLKIFEQKHSQFNAGKTFKEDHKEMLYVCTIK